MRCGQLVPGRWGVFGAAIWLVQGCLPVTDAMLPPQTGAEGTGTSDPTVVDPTSPAASPTDPVGGSPSATPSGSSTPGTPATATPDGQVSSSPGAGSPTTAASPTPGVGTASSPAQGTATPPGPTATPAQPSGPPTLPPTPPDFESTPPPRTPPVATPPVDGDGDGHPLEEDCDDNNPQVHPGAEDPACDGIDSNCDGTPEVGSVWYEDGDGDGYGAAELTTTSCEQPAGYVANADDCDDTNADVHPETTWYADADQDGYGDDDVFVTQCPAPSGYTTRPGDCNDDADNYYPGAPEEGCSSGGSADFNCDGSTSFEDQDGDGASACEDCNDGDASVYPGAPESCDYVDSDCDGDLLEDADDSDKDGRPDCVDGCVPVTPRIPAEKCSVGFLEVKLNGGPPSGSFTPGATFDWYALFYVYDCECSGCQDQVQVGWAHSGPLGCLYDANPYCLLWDFPERTGQVTVPEEPGRYRIVYDRSQDYQCPATWWGCTGGDNNKPVLIEICVERPFTAP